MEDKDDLSGVYNELVDWIEEGKKGDYFENDDTPGLRHQKDSDYNKWLDCGYRKGFLIYSGISQKQIASLDDRFKLVISLLSSLIILLPFVIFALVSAKANPFLIMIISGILGSSAAAFISTLDRYSNGYEDTHGNAYPDPKAKKQRFNYRFSNWLLLRPLLGIVAATLIYFGANTLLKGTDIEFDKTHLDSFAFVGIVAGLFAKTLFESLLDTFKSILGKS